MNFIRDEINSIVWTHKGLSNPLPGNPVPWNIWRLCEWMVDEYEKEHEGMRG